MTVSMLNVTHLRSFALEADQALPNVRPSGKPFATYIGDGDVVIGSIVQANAIPLNLLDSSRSSTTSTTAAASPTLPSPPTPPTTLPTSPTPPPTRLLSYLRAGPRKTTYHDPHQSCAAIVTCGGLCPGMNDVICSLTNTLKVTYQVPRVLGIRGGWWGFHKQENLPPMELDAAKVDGVQHVGGTMLGSSRGGFDADKVLQACVAWQVNLLFVIGGDGTHRGALAVADLAQALKIPMSVVGIPKTIDNDIGIIDRSFGFESAVAEAKVAIKSAKVEASCAPNGIGVVKLMGRDSGYIAAHSTISSHGDVDLLLIPELKIDFDVDSSTNIFNHLHNTLLNKGHAVVVLSEGAGAEHLLQETTRNSKTSADGTQPKLPPIGIYMKKRIQDYFNQVGWRWRRRWWWRLLCCLSRGVFFLSVVIGCQWFLTCYFLLSLMFLDFKKRCDREIH